ncbi:MAG: LPS export ABC transporter periplasmic protein LptC [Legionella longbeachae]|nr:LPS export ABC transporter periplasmic protein LptC [Legionella longbeachae]
MNATKQFMWFFLAFIILTCTGWYYSHSTSMVRLSHETLANAIDTTISHVTVRQFNQDGELVNFLTTPLMQHLQKDDIYLFQKPNIKVHQDKQPPWNISSKTAKSFEGGKRITFIGNVKVHQEKGKNTQESILKTEEITYFPKEKKASSHLLVTYEQPGNIIQSTGMNAYLDEKRVELLHQARGSYVPANG